MISGRSAGLMNAGSSTRGARPPRYSTFGSRTTYPAAASRSAIPLRCGRTPNASMQRRTAGCGPPSAGWKTCASTVPSGVGMSVAKVCTEVEGRAEVMGSFPGAKGELASKSRIQR